MLSNIKKIPNLNLIINDITDDNQIFCEICRENESFINNQIIICDVCNFGVHQFCYGEPLKSEIPEGSWICERCQTLMESSLSADDIQCIFCPNKKGIMKKSIFQNQQAWAHVICTNWIPEVYYENESTKDKIILASQNLWKRGDYQCSICKQKDVGICLNCDHKKVGKPRCVKFFHVTCAVQSNLIFPLWLMKKLFGNSATQKDYCQLFCENHLRKKLSWKKQYLNDMMEDFRVNPLNQNTQFVEVQALINTFGLNIISSNVKQINSNGGIRKKPGPKPKHLTTPKQDISQLIEDSRLNYKQFSSNGRSKNKLEAVPDIIAQLRQIKQNKIIEQQNSQNQYSSKQKQKYQNSRQDKNTSSQNIDISAFKIANYIYKQQGIGKGKGLMILPDQSARSDSIDSGFEEDLFSQKSEEMQQYHYENNDIVSQKTEEEINFNSLEKVNSKRTKENDIDEIIQSLQCDDFSNIMENITEQIIERKSLNKLVKSGQIANIQTLGNVQICSSRIYRGKKRYIIDEEFSPSINDKIKIESIQNNYMPQNFNIEYDALFQNLLDFSFKQSLQKLPQNNNNRQQEQIQDINQQQITQSNPQLFRENHKYTFKSDWDFWFGEHL